MDGEIVKCGDVAASNIARALGLPKAAEKEIAQAVEDEVNAMSAHFSFAMSDAYAQFESDLADAKKALDKAKFVGWAAALFAFAVGCALGLIHG